MTLLASCGCTSLAGWLVISETERNPSGDWALTFLDAAAHAPVSLLWILPWCFSFGRQLGIRLCYHKYYSSISYQASERSFPGFPRESIFCVRGGSKGGNQLQSLGLHGDALKFFQCLQWCWGRLSCVVRVESVTLFLVYLISRILSYKKWFGIKHRIRHFTVNTVF